MSEQHDVDGPCLYTADRPAEDGSALASLAASLPSSAVLAVLAFDTDPGGLFALEMQLVSHAAERRRADFSAGRRCARAALAAIDAPVGPILTGSGGEPLWPSGFTGSVSHCPGLAAAVAAPTAPLTAVGLDVERLQTLTSGVRSLLSADAAERRWLDSRPDLAVVVFSIKEAVMKAWWPVAGWWPGFQGVTVDGVDGGGFRARVTDGVKAPVTVEGHFAVDELWVCAAAVI